MATVRVAAAQIASRPGDIAANVELHLGAIEAARHAGVALLVFPELSLTGYENEPDLRRLERRADAAEIRAIGEAASDMVVVLGFVEANGTALPHNSCAVLAGGRLVHLHRKLNLPTYGGLVEGRHYGPGDTVGLFDGPLGPTACLICADTWNPALPWLAALSGAQAMLVPVASARGAVADDFDSREGWRVNLRHTALTYGLPAVMANQCGRAGALDFRGGSMIVDPFGQIVAEAGTEPDLLVTDLDLTDGARARARMPTVRDADPRGVRAALDRLLGSPSPSPALSAQPDHADSAWSIRLRA